MDGSGKILGEEVSSQLNMHLKNGGIIPPLAADLHREHIKSVVDLALEKSNISVADLDAIAVTNRPGLPLSLLVGLRYAKHLARRFNKPIIPIHHMEAHALTVRMEKEVPIPFLCLLVSGGHSLLTVCKDIDKFILLGESVDDAPGEAFDKIARRLKLRNIPEFKWMSGGQSIELAASRANNTKKFDFPLPLARYRNCQFSFAGLKNTANRHIYKEEKDFNVATDEVIPEYENFCAGLLKGITRHICHRTQRAIEFSEAMELFDKDDPRTIVVSGGVACNDFLFTAISQLAEQFGYTAIRPSKRLCTDNGIMIAWNGVERYRRGLDVLKEFDGVGVNGKCALGENWSEKVRDKSMPCKWAKIPILLDIKS